MIAISIGNGSGDAQGSERALEYDTMSGLYAEFVETEVLPLVERQYNVKLTKDPEGRATMGGSSGGSAAFIMAWYRPELYHRVLAYSITAVNQQWPHSAETPHGAWEFHERLIPNSPVKPIRVWLEVGDRDFLNPNVMRDDMHDWVVASENMARVLAAKGYHYQFVFARNAGHVDRGVKQQTLPEALEWLWKDYPIEGSKSAAASTSRAQDPPDWTEPFPPFRFAGNLYYIGSKGLANYLVTTPQGHILINSDLESSVPLIRASIEKLGFKFSDIKILLISHAHWDHDGGSAAIKGLTGAKYMVMDRDVSVVESGGKTDFQYGNQPASLYPPTKVDRVLHDGDEVKLGGARLVAHLTPGHTKGCTTWTMKVEEAGRTYEVVIVGSPNVNEGYKLVMNSSYPEIASDYERTFRVLKSLPVDIFLGAHGSYFDLEAKYARLKEGAVTPFIDPAGYKAYVTERENAFRTELAKQKAALYPIEVPKSTR
jgi:metallo-beta-lactamase class B